ncbi:MAG: twin-arginine translocase subunit TatB [Hyphomicrobiaceae bacterium]|nr:twin-arginine translocase subunit TatB [Hyphomicrobiaceae bacterium]
MFDIGWSELVVLGVIALIVVGPKELPALLRTIGRYTGFLKKQASEFRSQFDQAMREAELDQIKKDVQSFKDDITSTVQATTKTLTDEIDSAKRHLEIPELDDPDAHDADGMPIQKSRATVDAPAAATAPAADAAAESPAVPNEMQSRHEPSAADTMKSGA